MRREIPVYRIAISALFLLLTAACGTGIDPVEQPSGRFEKWQASPDEYRLQPADELDVRLVYNPEFSDRVVVGPDGRIHLSVIGAVVAEGKTPGELAREIEDLFAKELRRPDVVVVPRAYYSQVVFVGGEVGRPGVVTLTAPSSILQAVIAAGGLLPTARLDEVVVLRRTKDNKPMMRTINLRQVLEGRSMDEDLPVRRYDVVYVPRSHISEVNLWIDQHINQVLPFSRSFNYTLNRDLGPINVP